MSGDGGRIGLVDGSVDSDSRTFHVVLDPEVVIQLDELLAVTTDLPGGGQVTHYGIVTELRSRFEGADLPSDTGRVVGRTLPAEHVRRAEVRVLRVVPELFIAPHAGAPAARAVGKHRAAALFEDEMTRGKLPVGLDLGGAPVYADVRFVDGRSGGKDILYTPKIFGIPFTLSIVCSYHHAKLSIYFEPPMQNIGVRLEN